MAGKGHNRWMGGHPSLGTGGAMAYLIFLGRQAGRRGIPVFAFVRDKDTDERQISLSCFRAYIFHEELLFRLLLVYWFGEQLHIIMIHRSHGRQGGT